jgi:type II secretory pathway pseudopilin PulG
MTLNHYRNRNRAAFTMIEIAISLAVIGFALVAIIGILPTAMQVQKDNRQETTINQDYTMLMDAVKSGNKGLDDLTNYVFAITNTVTEILSAGQGSTYTYGYTYFGSWRGNAQMTPSYPITNGYRIVGLLSTPKYEPLGISGKVTGFYSNHVVAYVRSMSGAASEKFPQTNRDVQDLTLSYRVTADIVPFSDFNREWLNLTNATVTAAEQASRSNYFIFARNVQTNLHDVRFLFRWPLLPNGNTGEGRQAYRTMMGGNLARITEFGFPLPAPYPSAPSPYLLHFFEPRTYVKAQ